MIDDFSDSKVSYLLLNSEMKYFHMHIYVYTYILSSLMINVLIIHYKYIRLDYINIYMHK